MNVLPKSPSSMGYAAATGTRRFPFLLLIVVAVAAGASGVWYGTQNGAKPSAKVNTQPNEDDELQPSGPVKVEVVHPRAGGIDRICIQPGTLEPFESADLYAKVSG